MVTRETIDRMMRKLGVGHTQFTNIGTLLSVIRFGKVILAGEALDLSAAQKTALGAKITAKLDALSAALDAAELELA
jgi:hypothetical protein